MKVNEVMTHDVCTCSPDQSIRDVARMMADLDSGFIPVAENDRLVGTITDRDIAVRAIARGLGPDTVASDVMSADVKYCFEDETADHIAQNMAAERIRRLPVVNRGKRLVGVVSLGDLATGGISAARAGKALDGISQRGNGRRA